ncbi:MAG: hypothetical protein U1C74_22310 [Phenylobacterium sp.]|nr:hypothetical protein [Phenylobacterium sp.]
MNLSTLRSPELRQLLDAARTRGQAQLTYQILQEMEARRTARGQPRGLFRMRRPNAEPMALVLDSASNEPESDVTPLTRPDPPLALEASPDPSSQWNAPPEERLPAMPARPPRTRRYSRGSATFLSVGLAAGLVLGAGASELWRAAGAPMLAPAALETTALETARPASPPAPDVLPSAAAGPSAIAMASAVPAARDPGMADVALADTSPGIVDPAMELPAEPTPLAEEVDLAGAPRDACASQPTPADRTICGDAELQALQQALRRAYAHALDAHRDRDVLRQRQLAWRDSRNAVSNPDQLAQLYEDRTRRLNAAAEAALRAR